MTATVVGGVIVEVGGVPSVAAADIATVTCDPITASEPSAERSLESYDPMTPERVIDTRVGTGGVTGALDAGCTISIDMSDIGPDDVQAFALSVTVISPVRDSSQRFSCAEGQPGTSSVNARPGFPTPNLVIASPDSAGEVCLFSNRGGHVIVDVSGWWTPGTNRFPRSTRFAPMTHASWLSR